MSFDECMQLLKKTETDCTQDIKSADWKIQIAAVLKARTSATNGWIANKLNMGVPHAVSRYVGTFKANKRELEQSFQELIAKVTT